jgi:hypothetical protein
VTDRGWQRRFDDPVSLRDGRQLASLEDAGNYITKLPKAEHEAAEWQAAMEALILVATHGGPTMFVKHDAAFSYGTLGHCFRYPDKLHAQRQGSLY